MSADQSGRPVADDPLAQLERAFIEEFLKARGCDLSTIHDLPPDTASRLLKEASLYASGRLTEVETRAHFVEDIRDKSQVAPQRAPGGKR